MDPVLRVRPIDVGLETVRSSCQHKILDGASETDIQVVVVGVDNGATPRKVWEYRNCCRLVVAIALLDVKLPALCIVTRWRQCSIANQLVERFIIYSAAAAARHVVGLFVFVKLVSLFMVLHNVVPKKIYLPYTPPAEPSF